MKSRYTLQFYGALLLSAGVGIRPAAAQPLIAPRGIVNAATSVTPPGLPSGSIARGSIFSVFGSRMGPPTGIGAASFPLPETLAGVSLKITQGTVSVDAIPVYVSINQINAIMPSNAPLGLASAVVSFNNIPGPPSPVQIVNSSAGLFSVGGAGIGSGVFFNYISNENQPLNSPAISAKPGQVITTYATGLGPVTYADNIAASAGNLPTAVEVFVGGKAARVNYSGRAPGFAGEDQLSFEVPADAPLGCWVPVQVRTEGRIVSNSVTMAISADGSACSDLENALSKQLITGGKTGLISLFRLDQQHDLGREKVDDVIEFGTVTLRQEQAKQFAFNPLFSLPPAGSCTIYTGTLDLFQGDNPLLTAPTGKYLNGGSTFSLISPKGARAIAGPKVGPVNLATIGISFPAYYVSRRNLVLDGGNYQLNGDGGSEVGPIRATFPIAGGLTWTNRAQVNDVDRSQPLTISWTGAPSAQSAIIIGSNTDIPTNSSAMFVCIAQGSAGTFAVPPQILQALPASRTALIKSKGWIYVGSAPLASPPTFTATGLDSGVVMPLLFSGKDLRFR